MILESREALALLQDIADVEKRTREAMFYSGCSTILIVWGLLVACGYGGSAWQPGWSRIIWLGVSLVGCAATALIVATRLRARPREARNWRIIWALAALMIYGAGWSWVLGPVIPRHLIYAFQPSLVMLGMVLAGLWVGRFFVVLGLVGLALVLIGETLSEPWLRLWMAAAQSGTLIVGGLWLRRLGIPR
jgi:hypothetical protein